MTTTQQLIRQSSFDHRHGKLIEITHDVICYRQPIVNLYFYGRPGSGNWVLIDTGLPYGAWHIREQAERLYGKTRPQAIILTHGHFNHVSGVCELADEWDVPVFAHELERPYLDGRSSYPPGDPAVGGGGMAWLASLYPRGPINLGARLESLPAAGEVPGMPGWRWIHTPGHSPGHVSLFRDEDRCLIAGDAFVTTKQESMIAALMQPMQIHGPPAYYTIDWELAQKSVQALAELKPRMAATGHGRPMSGPELAGELSYLARHFQEQAVPAHGRYVRQPAIADETGVVFTPPPVINPRHALVLTAAVVGGAALLTYRARRTKSGLTRKIL